jgi:hypothetical protein
MNYSRTFKFKLVGSDFLFFSFVISTITIVTNLQFRHFRDPRRTYQKALHTAGQVINAPHL